MDTLALVKVGVSIAMVLALSLVAERAGPRLAGVLSGFPLGNALSLFFIGYEISPGFAADSALFAQAGFVNALCLTAGYLAGMRLPGRWAPAGALAAGLAAFFLAAAVLQFLPCEPPLLVGLTLLAVLAFARAYRHLPEARLTRRPLSFGVLLVRAAIAAALVLAVTAAAHVLPPTWAGMLAAFPITMLPFVVILHLTYGPAAATTALKHYPGGLGSLVCYALVVAWAYPRLGLGWGTAAAFAAAALYLVVLLRVRRRARGVSPAGADPGAGRRG